MGGAAGAVPHRDRSARPPLLGAARRPAAQGGDRLVRRVSARVDAVGAGGAANARREDRSPAVVSLPIRRRRELRLRDLLRGRVAGARRHGSHAAGRRERARDRLLGAAERRRGRGSRRSRRPRRRTSDSRSARRIGSRSASIPRTPRASAFRASSASSKRRRCGGGCRLMTTVSSATSRSSRCSARTSTPRSRPIYAPSTRPGVS